MKFSKDEHAIWMICVAVIILFSVLVYRDMTGSRGGGSGEIVGYITFKYNTAQRKYDSEVVWENLPDTGSGVKRIPIYNKDAIRTTSLAEATIELTKDGAQIKLDANSMIIIDVSDKSANIDYAYGSIRAASGSGGPSGLTIKTKDNQTIDVRNSDVKIAAAKGKDVSVTVNRGEARIAVGDQSQTVGKDQVAVVGQEIRVRPLNLRLSAPEDGRRVFIPRAEEAVSFSWSRSGAVGRVELQVARDPGFRNIAKAATVGGNGSTVRLPAGVYYWRVSAKNPDSGAIEASAVAKLTLVQKEPLQFAVPADQARLDYVKEEPLVAFAWNRTEFTKDYVLELARDRSFKSGLQRLESQSNTIAARLPEGTYYCRVSSRSDFPDAQSTSDIRVIRVVKREKLPPPGLLSPEGGRSISRAYVEKQGVLFNWRKHAQVASSELQIEGGGTTRTRTIAGSVFSLRESLPLGSYSWRVRGLDEQGQAITDFSANSPFTVVEDQKLRLLSPGNGETIDYMSARFPGVSLSWERPGFAANYRFRLSRNKDLSAPLQARESESPYANAGALPPGQYYWAVDLLSENKAVIGTSEVGAFQVSDLLSDPQPIFPAGGATVDMTSRNTLPLRWQALRGADAYIVHLYQVTDKGRKQIAQANLKNTEFLLQDLSVLDRGRFVWTLQAVRTSEGRAVRSRELAREFQITLEEREAPKVAPADVYIK